MNRRLFGIFLLLVMLSCCACSAVAPRNDYVLFSDKTKLANGEYVFNTDLTADEICSVTFSSNDTYGEFSGFSPSDNVLLLSYTSDYTKNLEDAVCAAFMDFYATVDTTALAYCINLIGEINGTRYVIAQFIVSVGRDPIDLETLTLEEVKQRVTYKAYAEFLQ